MKPSPKLSPGSKSTKLQPRLRSLACALALLCLGGLASTTPTRVAAAETGVFFASTTDDAKQALENAQKAAVNKFDELWRQIEQQRLSHRTRDEIVAWVIMGLLVGGLLNLLTNLKKPTTVFFGLAGAFLGGIVAHITRLNLGLGPVLIRYEDLLFSFAGGLLLVFVARSFMKKKQPKAKQEKD
jgi:uncharacterized membrane protein YeaQ/YmgE (transglycosylase-associated protein family)